MGLENMEAFYDILYNRYSMGVVFHFSISIKKLQEFIIERGILSPYYELLVLIIHCKCKSYRTFCNHW